MNTYQSGILGIVQGVTELLPISSSAHLVLVPFFLQWEDPGLVFDIALHIGTLFSILVYFRKDWIEILKSTFLKSNAAHYPITLKLIIIGTIPAGILGLLFQHAAETAFRAPTLIACTLAIFGILLWYFDKNGAKSKELSHFRSKDAFLIGLAQAVAIIPGVSRSGITITAALFLGFTRAASMRFSFLLSVPIIGAAGLLKSRHLLNAISHGGDVAANFLIGFSTSFISGYIAILFLSYLVRSKSFSIFTVYRLALSLFIIITVFVVVH